MFGRGACVWLPLYHYVKKPIVKASGRNGGKPSTKLPLSPQSLCNAKLLFTPGGAKPADAAGAGNGKFEMADRRDWGGGGDDPEESTQRMIERIWESLTDIQRRMDQQTLVPPVAVPPRDGETVPIAPVPPGVEVPFVAPVPPPPPVLLAEEPVMQVWYRFGPEAMWIFMVAVSLNGIRVDANLCDLQNIGLPEGSSLTPFSLSLALFSCPCFPNASIGYGRLVGGSWNVRW
ncbi:hypothetical protein Taro_042012 [Colocasia esculenta]|uniref:Uncharacterized protein n=1 Tax=Colocasia esculenta TaxID=4460 RepID=A0A843WNC1_COLES|nr:hypothetical protein [Colocasia esculenta]